MFLSGKKCIPTPFLPTTVNGNHILCNFKILCYNKRKKGSFINSYINEIIDASKNGTLKEAFGAGTAAVVSHIAEITHGDMHMILPVDTVPCFTTK